MAAKPVTDMTNAAATATSVGAPQPTTLLNVRSFKHLFSSYI